MILKLKSAVKEHYHYHSTANNNLLHSPGLSQLRSQDGEEKLHLSCVQIWQPFCPAQPGPGLCLGRYAYPCHRKLFHPVPQAPHRSYGPQTLAVGCCGASREGVGATHIPLAGPVMCLHMDCPLWKDSGKNVGSVAHLPKPTSFFSLSVPFG